MFKLCVFDLDGTLINSIADLGVSTNWALNKYGFPTYEIDKYRYMVGDGVPVLIKRALKDAYSESAFAKVLESFNFYYNGHFADNTRPYDGIEKMLNALLSAGIKIAVLSNKPDNFVKLIIEKLFPQTSFDFVMGKTDSFPKKPEPDALLHIIEHMGVQKAETLYIGDSNVDIHTAKNAGVKSAGVLWGFRDREELETAGADIIAADPAGLLSAAGILAD